MSASTDSDADAGSDSDSNTGSNRLQTGGKNAFARLKTALDERFASVALFPAWVLVATALTGSLVILVSYSFLEVVPPRGSYQLTIDNYLSINHPVYISTYLTSIRIAVVTTVLCAIIGYPVAYFLSVTKSKYRTLLLLAILLPIWVNVVIKAYSWQLILGEQGLINYLLGPVLNVIDDPLPLLFSEYAIIVGLVHVWLPFIVLPLYTTMRQIDHSQLEAVKNLGGNRLVAFIEIVLPQTLPGLAAGGVFVFILSFGALPEPAILGGSRNNMIANVMTDMFRGLNNWGLGSAMAVVFTLIVVAVVALVSRFANLGAVFNAPTEGEESTANDAPSFALPRIVLVKLNAVSIPDRVASNGLKLITFVTIAFMYLPIGVVALLSFSPTQFPRFPMGGYSFQWYAQLIPPEYDAELINALVTSVQLGILAAVCAGIIGTLAVLGMMKGSFTHRLFQRDVLSLGFILPMVIPWIVTGIAMLTLFSAIGIQGSFVSLVIGHTFLTLPFVFTVVAAQYQTLDDGLEEAARDLGADRFKTLREITLPLMAPGIVAGVLFSFSISFDNFTQAFFWSGPGTQTLPVLIFNRIQFGVEPSVNAIGTIIVVVSLLLAFIGERIAKRYV